MNSTIARSRKMRISAFGILAFLLLAGCDRGGIDTIAEKEVTLKKGMPHTIILPNGNIIYDISGEWDAIYDNRAFGKNKDIVKITQTGNKFVGVKLIGNEYMPKGSKTFKGELAKSGFLSVSGNSQSDGWSPGRGKIFKQGKKMIIETPIKSMDFIVIIKLSRK